MEEKYFNVQRSLGRALINNPKLIDRFYELFMNSHSDIRPLFSKTDFKLQTEALKQGLNTAILYAQANPVAETTLKHLRETHGRNQMNIAPALVSCRTTFSGCFTITSTCSAPKPSSGYRERTCGSSVKISTCTERQLELKVYPSSI